MSNNSGFQIRVNCTVHWAFLKKPNPYNDKYECVLGNLSDAAVTNLKGAGITVHSREDKPEQGNYITCRSTLPIGAYDESGNAITALIGNGSRAIATVGSYEWAGKKKGQAGGISPSLKKLTITDLVEVTRREQEPV